MAGRKLVFSPAAWEESVDWQQTDRKKLKRISRLIRETARQPFEGLGKPEALRHSLSGYWSRRIDDEHRFVYRVTDEALIIVQLHYHYTS